MMRVNDAPSPLCHLLGPLSCAALTLRLIVCILDNLFIYVCIVYHRVRMQIRT